MLVAIYNPVAGDRTAKQIFEDEVFPLLTQHGKSPVKQFSTERAGHAGTIVKDLIGSLDAGVEEITVVLGSGDGTLHEIINSATTHNGGRHVKVSIVLIPCGTANALYYSVFPPGEGEGAHDKLKSLKSYLSGGVLKSLTVAITTLVAANGKRSPHSLLSSVVVSTALHASILHDSESLRKEMPGIERFKVAAQQNQTRWYHATAEFMPIPGSGDVQIYDPSTKSFRAVPEGATKLEGPFAYFLSTVNVDRLEVAFRITPLAALLPPPEACLDVVVLRPLRHPDTTSESDECRKEYVNQMWGTMAGAYRGGDHVDIRYSTGEAAVEYYRCGGWKWIPAAEDGRAHMICTDGYITQLETGGHASCSIGSQTDNEQFAMYA
ncbi:Lipid Phosphate Formation and Regulation [Pleurotus pulmonarius]